MGRIEESIPNYFALFACGKAEVRSRLMDDSRLTLQVFSQEELSAVLQLDYLPWAQCVASIYPTALAMR